MIDLSRRTLFALFAGAGVAAALPAVGTAAAAKVADSGFMRAANGLLVQWGRYATRDESHRIIFPVAFEKLLGTQCASTEGGHIPSAIVATGNTEALIVSLEGEDSGYWVAFGV